MLRGLHVQPHTAGCRARMEQVLESDIRIKNAKIRMQERGRKIKKDEADGENLSKKQKLEDIEEAAMMEEDPTKLNELFEKYRAEYLKDRDTGKDGDAQRLRTAEPAALQERSTGSGDPAV